MQRTHGAVRRGEDVPLGVVFKPGRFGRMFPQLEPFLPDDAALDALAATMKEGVHGATSDDNKNIPAGYTYLGQFVDHDITFDTTTMPEQPVDPQAVHNFRTPKLELDSLYGIGPGGQPYLYRRDDDASFLIGKTIAGFGDPTIPAGMDNDLPRSGQGFALIGDPRNDENLLVAQTHVAFLKFHNAVVRRLKAEGVPKAKLFDAARREVIWHYQWIVLHDFVARLVDRNALERALTQPRRFYLFRDEPFIPVEFSVAAYRLGHSMVRQEYQHNRVFRTGGAARGTFDLLFFFTGLSGKITGVDTLNPNGFPATLSALPSDWIIDWRRFFDFTTNGKPPKADFNFSRTIDPYLAEELTRLPGSGSNLAALNLRRGKRMQLPSGQAVAAAMGFDPLPPDVVASGPDAEADVLRAHGFDRQTPLWYYILKEAQIDGDGARLGPVGSTILAEVFVGLLEGDPESFLAKNRNWKPTLPGRRPGHFTMRDLIQFVENSGDPIINPIGDAASPAPPAAPMDETVVEPAQ